MNLTTVDVVKERDQLRALLSEMREALKGMLQSYDLAVENMPEIPKNMVMGFFVTEPKRAKDLVEKADKLLGR